MINPTASSLAILNSASDYGNSLMGIEFPLSVLPQRLQHVVMQLHEYNGFPVEYTAVSMVGLLGLAIGTTHKVHLMKGWDDMAILNIALVGEPGTNKSNPLNFLVKPFEDADAEFLHQYNMERRAYEERKAAAKGEIWNRIDFIFSAEHRLIRSVVLHAMVRDVSVSILMKRVGSSFLIPSADVTMRIIVHITILLSSSLPITQT